MFDLQRAAMGKRIAAFLLDLILFAVAATGAGFLLSTVTGYDSHSARLQECYDKYESEYGVTFNITSDELASMTGEEQANYKKAVEALSADADADAAFRSVASLSLLIVSASLLIGFLALECLVPALFGNGQTVGKKIFGIGVITPDGIRITRFQLFVRSILGKYTVETMIPTLLIILYIFSGLNPLLLFILLIGIAVLQGVLLITTENRTPIHDLIAGTVAVDLQSQMIFENEEEKEQFKNGSSPDGGGENV